MKNFLNFINEKLTNKQNSYIDIIVNYIKKYADFDIYEYNEEFVVNKFDSDEKLTGKLFFILDNKAIRFNFNKEKLVSIDLWDNFVFEEKNIYNKPNFTLDINNSIVNMLDDIVDFINGNFKINENDNNISVNKASDEKVELKSLNNILDLNIDIFESIKLYTAQVYYKMSNSLIVSGLAGLGKTTEVEQTLEQINADYVAYSGEASVAGLYESLFINRNKLILFDDIDSIFEDKTAVNLLKAVCDTKEKRVVSRALKSYFDSDGMTDSQIWDTYQKTKKLPKKFTFTGRIIFITNISGKNLDKAMISRSLFVDVNPDKPQIIERIKSKIPKIKPEISMDIKNEVLDLMLFIDENMEFRFPLNLRTFVHCLNIRLSNDFMMNSGDEQIKAWVLLIKQYLVI